MFARTSLGVFVAALFAGGATIAQGLPPVLPIGKTIADEYRQQFALCDENDTFYKVQFPLTDTNGHFFYQCNTNRSNLVRLEKIEADPAKGTPEAIIIGSKIALDNDGSASACSSNHGHTDQCSTALMLFDQTKCPWDPNKDGCVPVDADSVPYVVLPTASPAGHPEIDGHQFRTVTGLRIGDYGVVIAHGKVVSVIIADGGPANKIGEGSGALLKKLSKKGEPTPIDDGAVFILFPRTRDPVRTLTNEALASQNKGINCYRKLVGQGGDCTVQ